jgi:hypothetical protein
LLPSVQILFALFCTARDPSSPDWVALRADNSRVVDQGERRRGNRPLPSGYEKMAQAETEKLTQRLLLEAGELSTQFHCANGIGNRRR